jgi:hypothetical protein
LVFSKKNGRITDRFFHSQTVQTTWRYLLRADYFVLTT